ncbi:MAG TPA: glycosyltransferase family 2 protein, partial [Tissierellaceae bacterium]
MRKDNKVFLISLTILILLGIGVTIIFRQVLFPFDKNIYLIAWIVAYMLLIIQLFYVPTSYSRNTNVSSKHRINAIISSYNEDDKNLKDTINSILNQDYPVQKIFVIDDGSKIPIKKFKHPKIVWLREENSGKRYAQKLAIDMMEEDEVDFILTVDSDSVLEKKATKKMLEEFERSKSLMGITGLVLTSNFRDNILTRIVDLNIAISCV